MNKVKGRENCMDLILDEDIRVHTVSNSLAMPPGDGQLHHCTACYGCVAHGGQEFPAGTGRGDHVQGSSLWRRRLL